MSPVVGSPPWTSREDERLRALAISGKSGAEIAKQLGRTKQAVQNRIHKLGISLKRVKIRPKTKRNEEPREERSDQGHSQESASAHEALAGLERAQRLSPQSDKARGPHLNDDKSPLIDLLSCIVCSETMKIEKSAPDAEGKDIIQYRCGRCDRIECVRLFRRTRSAPA
jgi:hypothetical protein